MNKLLHIIIKYSLNINLIEWAGIFRLLGTRGGFTVVELLELSTVDVQKEIAELIFEALREEGLLRKSRDHYYVVDDHKLQRKLEMLEYASQLVPNGVFHESPKLLWTEPPKVSEIPLKISSRFDYLYSFINKAIQTTQERLIFFAPYYSVSGIERLKTSLNAIIHHRSNLTIDWIIGEKENTENLKAIDYIIEHFCKQQTNQIRVFNTSNFDFHAKLLLSDYEKGYMGSANFSSSGLKHHFELGAVLDKIQSKFLTELIDHWITIGLLETK